MLGVAIVIIIGAAIGVWIWSSRKEGFMNVAGVNLLGSIDDAYEPVRSPDELAPVEDFADLVDAGDYGSGADAPTHGDSLRPMQRLERLQGSQLLPKTTKGLTPYNVSVADPKSYYFVASAPRVLLKDRQWETSDKIRGDLIFSKDGTMNPMVGISRYGRDSLNLSGFFSDTYKALYNKYTTHSHKNMPLVSSNEETLMDYN